jgi:hypothetical protein
MNATYVRHYNIILKMHPFLRDEALTSTRKHAACTNGVRTKYHDFWAAKIRIIPRKSALFFIVNMISITPGSKIWSQNF